MSVAEIIAKLDAFSAAQDSRPRMLMWLIGTAPGLKGISARLWR